MSYGLAFIAPVSWNSLPSQPCRTAHHSTYSSPASDTIASPIFSLFTSLFPINLILALLHFLSSLIDNLYSPVLLSDWCLWYWPCFDFSLHRHFASTYLHLIHQLTFSVCRILISVQNCVVINFLNFYEHSKPAPFHTIVHSFPLVTFHYFSLFISFIIHL